LQPGIDSIFNIHFIPWIAYENIQNYYNSLKRFVISSR
jgi:hypothetical protein